jgi:single-stranded-DNA-specific exonuclease
MKERLHRPVFAFAPAEPGSDSLRGSARSIPGVHIRDLLAAVDSAQPGLIGKFGGHAMAAGLSLSLDALPQFQRVLHEQARRVLDPSLLQAEVVSDGELQRDEFNHAAAIALRDSGPWGQGYPEPLFDGAFEVLDWRVVGQRHLKLELGKDGIRLNAIEFGGWTDEPPSAQVRIAFRLEPDTYRGGEAIQLVVVHREPL